MKSWNPFATVSLVLLTLATAVAGDRSPQVSVVRGGSNSIPPGYRGLTVRPGITCGPTLPDHWRVVVLQLPSSRGYAATGG